MSPATWSRLLRDECAALAKIADGDVAATEQAGRAAIALWPNPIRRAEVLRRFAANPRVTAMGSEFVGVLLSASHAIA